MGPFEHLHFSFGRRPELTSVQHMGEADGGIQGDRVNASKSGASTVECKERGPCCADLTTYSGSGGTAGGSDDTKVILLIDYISPGVVHLV